MLLVAPLPSAASCIHGTRPAVPNYTPPPFNYTGETGPLNWHARDKLCATGTHQSPINILPGCKGVKTLGESERPVVKYPPVQTAELENRGYTLEVHAHGELTYNGVTWHLCQFHFHTPSEHRLEYEYFPVEAHFVHYRDCKEIKNLE